MTRFEVTVRAPMRLRSLPNERLMPKAFARLKAETRKLTNQYLVTQAVPFRRLWRSMEKNPKFRLQVVMVRVGPVKLDDDNCTGAFKPVRDQLAHFFDIDDGSPRWEWLPVVQERGLFGMRIHIEVIDHPAFEHPAVTKAKRAAGDFSGYPTVSETNRIIRRIKSRRPTPNVRKPR